MNAYLESKLSNVLSSCCAIAFVCFGFVSGMSSALALDLEENSHQNQNQCVILLHGMARTKASMNKLEKALKKNNYQVVNDGYPSTKHAVEVLAELAVSKAIKTCLQNDKVEKIHFITHSLGGILVRYYLSKHALDKLGRVVMLSPPNQGSEVVDTLNKVPGFFALNGPAGLQLGTEENSIVNKLGPVSYEVGVITGNKSVNLILSTMIPGDDDGKVSLASARLEGMADYRVLPHSHPFIMRSQSAIKQSLYFLQNGKFER